MWIVKSIFESDYGCEERMPGEPLMVMVVLESDDGRVCQFEIADEWLRVQDIKEGDEWPEDPDAEDPNGLNDKIDRQEESMANFFLSLMGLEGDNE